MEKKKRTQCLRNFTRSATVFDDVSTKNIPFDLVKKAFDKVESCYEKLEAAQDEYILVAAEEETDDYLAAPGVSYQRILGAFGAFQQKSADDDKREEAFQVAEVAEKERQDRELKFTEEKVQFELEMENFARLNLGFTDMMEDASDSDKRKQLEKLQGDMDSLQEKLVLLGKSDPSQDLKTLKDVFDTSVTTPFKTNQKFLLSALKDSSAQSSTSDSKSSVVGKNTKKETVKLPSFKGDLKSSPSPYLTYPVWRKRWNALIKGYDAETHIDFLLDKLDAPALLKVVGYEEDYVAAMKQLDIFYGDPVKVVSCVIAEVNAPSAICEGDYRALIDYSVVLEQSYNRLSSLDLVHELSNSSTMTMMLGKFPSSVGEKWAEHIVAQDVDVKVKPFPELITWLVSQKEIWERVAAVEASKEGSSTKAVVSYASGGRNNPPPPPPPPPQAPPSGVKCYRCQKTGHRRSECPDKKKNPNKKVRTGKPKFKLFWCAFHKGDPSKQCESVSCNELRQADKNIRVQLLKTNKDCEFCIGDHDSSNCNRKERICGGGSVSRGCSNKHAGHELFCLSAKVFAVNGTGQVVLLISAAKLTEDVSVSVFWDLGSTDNFIRTALAEQMNFEGHQVRLCVTTLNGVETDYAVTRYKCTIQDQDGNVYELEAYGLESITGALTSIDAGNIKKLFPHYSEQFVASLLRASVVDFLIGMQHPSWHPRPTERSEMGGDIWLYTGPFGSCIGGRHPDIKDETRRSDDFFTVNYVHHINVTSSEAIPHNLEYCPGRVTSYTHKGGFCESSLLGKPVCSPLPAVTECSTVAVRASSQCHAVKTSIIPSEEQFMRSEALGTTVSPECGSCRCGNCPVLGSKYNLREQQDLQEVDRNLRYCAQEKRWYTVYPWICPRSTLPKNDTSAYQCLLSIERRLSQDPVLAEDFCQQIESMVERGAATILSNEQLESWTGDYHFLPLVAVKGKKGTVRVCHDASRRQGRHPSMNDCLRKGPDRFLNNLLAVQLCFRNGRVGCVADIAKFHNQVYLEEEDVHMQRFFWRNMKTSEKPSVYAVKVNNFGVVSANCIATVALHKSADAFAEIYPVEAEELKSQTYIDDELMAAENKEKALVKTSRIDEISEYAGMPNKGWTYSGDDKADISIAGEGDEDEKVLGTLWCPKTDMFKFRVKLCFNVKRGAAVTVSTVEELVNLPSNMITRRTMLSNIHRIFDPQGSLIPVLLQAKHLLRTTWTNKDIGWDDPLPAELCEQWVSFMSSLLSLGDVTFPRSLWPEGEVVGKPILVIFTDGSASAFGAVAYIRWKLSSGQFWTRLIMAKGKIGPIRMISIPRMELNGTVMGNRIDIFLRNDTNLEFEKTYFLVDSSTVLGYVNKECGAFKPYEGIRVAEIQNSNEFVDGSLLNWAWVPTELNPADWCTKPRPADKIMDSFWVDGPAFLRQEEHLWPIKFTFKTSGLEGEITVGKKINVYFTSITANILQRLLHRSSRWKRLVRVLCWMLRVCFKKNSCEAATSSDGDLTSGGEAAASSDEELTSGGEAVSSSDQLLTSGGDVESFSCLSAAELARAKTTIIKHAQEGMQVELSLAAEKGTGRYRKLNPSCDEDGVWRVGHRLRNHVPHTKDNKMPVILPPKHRLTLLVMRDAHLFSHAGHDGTLSRFHQNGFWTVRAGQLAKSVKNRCVPCRKVGGELMSQVMGDIPQDRFSNLQPWSNCQIDLFGPFTCRGDANVRSSKKTWGLIVEDCNSGGVHLDIVGNYSADAVIMSLRRFGSLRGWPSLVQSDPGSQLVSASGTLVSWWDDMRTPLQTFAGSESLNKPPFQWQISPADSPWRQGKAERRIGIVKRLVKLSVGDTKLSSLELQTALMEIADQCNERPLGGVLPREDGTFELVTPNQLLTGRSGNIVPDDSTVVGNLPMTARYRVVSHVSSCFWSRWCSFVAPSLVTRQKWHKTSRNIVVGDLVMIADSNKLKNKYKLGIVVATNIGGDGNVRSATVRYFSKKSSVWRAEEVVRSVQRLVMILPTEEQQEDLIVQDDGIHVSIAKAGV